MRAGRPRTQAVRTFVALRAGGTPAHPGGALSSVGCLGEMSDVLHSRAPLPLIPPALFSHKRRRGSLGAFAPHPPRPLLPQGEKGEFGRPDD